MILIHKILLNNLTSGIILYDFLFFIVLNIVTLNLYNYLDYPDLNVTE